MSEPTNSLAPIFPVASSTALETRWTRDQIDLIKRTVAMKCTDDELAMFMHICSRTALDPLAKQIYAIKRRQKVDGQWVEVMVVQTGIDGLRLQAERTGKFRGFTPTLWCGKDGVWKDVWLDAATPPAAAKVAVLRDGTLEPTEGIAVYQEYVQTFDGKPMARWAAAPAHMLAKCAEALALRRAFPAELAGLFSHEEMGQADMPPQAPKVAPPQRKSEKLPPKAEGASRDNRCPLTSPWTGEFDDIHRREEGSTEWWEITAHQGRLEFVTDQVEIKDKAAEAISNGKAVSVEWVRTKKGNARVETLVVLMDA